VRWLWDVRTHRRERELQVASVVYTDFAEVQSRDEVPANECANTLGDVATCLDADGNEQLCKL
jgi:hypothetical protein